MMLGAAAVQMGTRFLTATECTVHENYKKKVIAAKDIDSEVTGRANGHPVRQIRNKLTREYLQMERNGASLEEMEKLTLGSLRKAVVEGDVVDRYPDGRADCGHGKQRAVLCGDTRRDYESGGSSAEIKIRGTRQDSIEG